MSAQQQPTGPAGRPAPGPGLTNTEWDAFVEAVYQELRRLAQVHMEREPAGHTLQATALVHEAYLKLQSAEDAWAGRAHFYNAAAQAMRRILVDHARRRRRPRVDDGALAPDIEPAPDALEEGLDLVLLDEALEHLEALDPRGHQVVHLRFFVGLGTEEIAEMMQLSPRTVKREWTAARLWLYDWIHKRKAGGGDVRG